MALHRFNPFSRLFDRCLLCHQPIPVGPHTAHVPEFKASLGICTICHPILMAASLDETSPNTLGAISGFNYQFPVDYIITQFKFHAKFQYLKPLITVLITKIQDIYNPSTLPDYLIPIPLHDKKLQSRGFNQSLLICKALSNVFGIPILNALIRTQNTPAQSKLDAIQRRHNLKHAFALHPTLSSPLKNTTLALIDDVITTGTTMAAAQACLFTASTQAVDLWSLARA